MSPSDETDPTLLAALEERNALWAQALHARALRREVDELRELLAAREASRSWRLTAPLRRIAGQVRGARPTRSTPTPSDTSSASRA